MNSKPSKIIILALFALIVLVSGCLTGTQCPVVASQTEGLVVDRFAPSYNLVTVGDRITLSLEVINRGNSDAELVNATLWSHSGFTVNGSDTIDVVALNFNRSLQAPDMIICSPGDAVSVQWKLNAGCDPVETIFSVYLDYHYESEGYATILLASHEEAAKTQGAFGSSETGENYPSAGPLQVQIEPLQTEPIIVTEYSSNFDIRVLFDNVGTGLVGKEGFGEIGKTVLTVQGPCAFKDGCDKAGVCSTITWDKNDVHLRSGDQEALKVAKLEFTGDPKTFIKDVCRINVKSEYDYRAVVATKQTMGVIGSNYQVNACRGHEDLLVLET